MNNRAANNQTQQNRQQTALAVVPDHPQPSKLAKLDVRELRELGAILYTSGAFPDAKSEAAVMVKILAGHELGFSPLQSMTGIHFFQGKVSLGSTLIASLIKDSGRYDYEVLEHDNEKCSVQFKQFKGDRWENIGVPVTYTTKDAQGASLMSNPAWKNHPADMLFASCIRKGARRYTPDIFRGTTAAHDTPFDDAVDTVDVQEAQTTNPAEGEVLEPADVTHAPGSEAANWEQQREEKIKNIWGIVRELSDLGDSVKGQKSLFEFINVTFEVEDGLDSLSFESLGRLAVELENRRDAYSKTVDAEIVDEGGGDDAPLFTGPTE